MREKFPAFEIRIQGIRWRFFSGLETVDRSNFVLKPEEITAKLPLEVVWRSQREPFTEIFPTILIRLSDYLSTLHTDRVTTSLYA